MIGHKLNDAINEQMKWEMYSANLYIAMSAWAESEDLPGVASWFRVQVQEETFHFNKFFNFVAEAGGRVMMGAIEQPKNDYDSVLDSFKHSLAHEREVTRRINGLMDLALGGSEHAAAIFLQWFVTEQVEEESTFGGIVAKLERIGDDGNGLLMLDDELAARVFTPPIA